MSALKKLWHTHKHKPPKPPKNPLPPATSGAGSPATVALTTSDVPDGSRLGVHILREPETKADTTVDIVFIHGLTGNAYNTWYHTASKVHWPRDLIFEDIPDARVITYGYDADVTSFWAHASHNRLREHAANLMIDLIQLREKTDTEHRKILFVVHSLGGLVLQKALCVSRDRAEPHLQLLESSTKGIVFLGTPHCGSDLASWASTGAKIVRKLKDANVDIINTLERESEVLRDTQDTFGQLLRLRIAKNSPIRITCFFEELPVAVVGTVVPMSSACLFGYDSYGIHANHMDMTKFASDRDPGYQRIVGELQRVAKEARKQQQGQEDISAANREEILRILAVTPGSAAMISTGTVLASSMSWVLAPATCGLYEWLTASNRLFWISGNPGSGKSTVMSFISEHQPQVRRIVEREQALVAKPWRGSLTFAMHRLARRADPLSRSIEGVLRSLIYQLLQQHPILFIVAFPLIKSAAQLQAAFLPWSRWQLEQILLDVLAAAKDHMFMLQIDGLDEFGGEHAEIALFVRRFAEKSSNNLRLCVSSRPYTEFRFEFKDYPSCQIELHTKSDITSYVLARFRESERVLDAASRPLAEKVISRAQGVFLWVRLVVDSLQRGWRNFETVESLENRLEAMPEDLVDLYQQILNEVDVETRPEVHKLLNILAAARRPMFVEELHEASKHAQCTSLPKSSMICTCLEANLVMPLQEHDATRFRGRLVAISRGLIQVADSAEGASRVYLLHTTVLTFILNKLQPASDRSDITYPAGHFLLLHSCIHYIRTLCRRDNVHGWRLVRQDARSSWSEAENDYFVHDNIWFAGCDYVDLCQGTGWDISCAQTGRVTFEPFGKIKKLIDTRRKSRSDDFLLPSNAERHARYPLEICFLPYAIQFWLDHARRSQWTTSGLVFDIVDNFAGWSFSLWRHLFQAHNAEQGRVLPSNRLAVCLDQGLHSYVSLKIRARLTHGEPWLGELSDGLHCCHDSKSFINYLLFINSKTGSVSSAKLLLDAGAEITTWEETAAGSAYQVGPLPGVTLRHFGQAALARAVLFENHDLVGMLCRNGADLTSNEQAPYPMRWLRSGGFNRMKTLAGPVSTQRSSTRSVTVKGGRTFSRDIDDGDHRIGGLYNDSTHVFDCLHLAVQRGSLHCVKAILSNADAYELRQSLHPALIKACQQGWEEIVLCMVTAGADVLYTRPGANCLARNGQPCCALVPAVHIGNAFIVHTLVHAGARRLSPGDEPANMGSTCSPAHPSAIRLAQRSANTNSNNSARWLAIIEILGRLNGVTSTLHDNDDLPPKGLGPETTMLRRSFSFD